MKKIIAVFCLMSISLTALADSTNSQVELAQKAYVANLQEKFDSASNEFTGSVSIQSVNGLACTYISTRHVVEATETSGGVIAEYKCAASVILSNGTKLNNREEVESIIVSLDN